MTRHAFAIAMLIAILATLDAAAARAQETSPPASNKPTAAPSTATFADLVAALPVHQRTSPFAATLPAWLTEIRNTMRAVTGRDEWTVPIDLKNLEGLASVRRQAIRTRGNDVTRPRFGGGAIEVEGRVGIAHLMTAAIRCRAARINHARQSVIRTLEHVESAAVDDSIVIAGSANIGHARNSLILVDGHAQVAHATNCVIIARGAVIVSTSSGDVIVGGVAADVTHVNPQPEAPKDGAAAPPPNRRSLIASGGVLQVPHARHCVLAARGRIDAGSATDVVFVNGGAAAKSGQQRAQCRYLERDVAALPRAGRDDGPTLKLLALMRGRPNARPHAVKLMVGSETHELWLGHETSTIRRGPLEGWRLSFTGDGFAVLTKERRDLVVTAPKSAPEAK